MQCSTSNHFSNLFILLYSSCILVTLVVFAQLGIETVEIHVQQVPAANQNGNQWRIQQCSPQVRHRLIRATVKICAS